MIEIRDLIDRSLAARDPDSEAVIADWCEENGHHLHADSIRSGIVEAIPHLRHWIAEPAFELALFLDALSFFRACSVGEWVKEAEWIHAPDRWDGRASFARTIDSNGDDGQPLVTRRYVAELVHPTLLAYRGRAGNRDRYCAFGEVLRRACATCGAPALIVIRNDHVTYSDTEPTITYVKSLCLRGPHVSDVGTQYSVRRS